MSQYAYPYVYQWPNDPQKWGIGATVVVSVKPVDNFTKWARSRVNSKEAYIERLFSSAVSQLGEFHPTWMERSFWGINPDTYKSSGLLSHYHGIPIIQDEKFKDGTIVLHYCKKQ